MILRQAHHPGMRKVFFLVLVIGAWFDFSVAFAEKNITISVSGTILKYDPENLTKIANQVETDKEKELLTHAIQIWKEKLSRVASVGTENQDDRVWELNHELLKRTNSNLFWQLNQKLNQEEIDFLNDEKSNQVCVRILVEPEIETESKPKPKPFEKCERLKIASLAKNKGAFAQKFILNGDSIMPIQSQKIEKISVQAFIRAFDGDRYSPNINNFFSAAELFQNPVEFREDFYSMGIVFDYE